MNKVIFIVSTSYPNEQNPVANFFVKDQVKAISSYNDTIVVLNVQKQPSKFFLKKMDHSIKKGVDDLTPIYRVKCKTFIESKFRLFNFFLFKKYLKKIYKAAINDYGNPDVIFAHFYKAGLASISVSNNEVPIVTMEHSGEIMKDKLNIIDKIMLKKALYKSVSYICTTEQLKFNVMQKVKTNKEIIVVPNVVDDVFKYVPITNENFTFCTLSRLEFDKRVDLVIMAFCDCFRNASNIYLKIGGAGPEFAKLQRIIKENNMEGKIELLGRLDRGESFELMAKSNCFVLPSRHETFGLVWREALCVGRPVITTNHGGFSEKDWKSSYGEMISVDDVTSLSKAMIYIYNNYKDYDLKTISKENREMYSMSSIGTKIYAILMESVNKRQKGEKHFQ